MIDLSNLNDITSEAERLAEEISKHKWVIGHLAWIAYTEHGMPYGEFAKAINAGYKSVNEYANVYAYYRTNEDMPLAMKQQIASLRECPVLRYTHFRDAKRLKDLQASLDFLDECAVNLWSVDKARAFLGDDTREEMSIVWDSRQMEGLAAKDIGNRVQQAVRECRRKGCEVRVVVYEIETKAVE